MWDSYTCLTMMGVLRTGLRMAVKRIESIVLHQFRIMMREEGQGVGSPQHGYPLVDQAPKFLQGNNQQIIEIVDLIVMVLLMM